MARQTNFLANLPGNPIIAVLLLVMVVGLGGAAFNAWYILRYAGYDQHYLELTGEMRVLSQQIATSAREATSGQAAAFDALKKSQKQFDSVLQQLLKGDSKAPSPQDKLGKELAELSGLWSKVNSGAGTIVSNRERVLFLHDVAKTLNDSIPELQQEYNNVTEILASGGTSADQVMIAQRQSWLAERIARNVDKMLQGQSDASQAADQFNLDASTFGTVLQGMLNGNAAMRISRVNDKNARSSLDEINKLFQFVSGSVDEIFQASPELTKTSQAATAIAVDSPKILDATSTLAEHINRLEGERFLTTRTALIFVAIVLAALAAMGVMQFTATRARLRETAEQNERNQNAILRLLDELTYLADGDLTTTATVTEDFTGAIADSINFTIDQLRILVSQINNTAVKVSQAAQETQSTALNLAEASEHQAQEIAGASAAVNEMAVTIDQVSSNASESASVAERSVAIANTGAEVVQNTIKGMDNIREQIQETSKRIKRLGESSQE
ncbi:MAG TPA: type IV pili methyl-accepting chemotaxis transducer N-terminal domain-containing protein, partial [Spongiibacteraceae bacterium]|nr:type IV pili methyl-accepting chemotaxis transducer N-terminal domain-containing protein [Spongiibacteraceae bacterium]